MTAEDPTNEPPRENRRVPLETKVNLEFEKFSGFITEYSSNISPGGMFIKIKEPKPVGTIFSFEFKLTDNFRLIQGLGEVIWIRPRDLTPEKPAGMGVRFHEIDAASKELITTMVDQYVKRGGKMFDLAAETPQSNEPPKGVNAVEEDFKALFSVPDPAGPEAKPKITPDLESEASTELSIEDELPSSPKPIARISKPASRPAASAAKNYSKPAPPKKRRAVPVMGIVIVLLAGLGAAAYFFKDMLAPTIANLFPEKQVEKKQPPLPVTPHKQEVKIVNPTLVPTVVLSPPPAPTPSPTAASHLASATSLENITWERNGRTTILTLWGDGEITADRFTILRVQGTPPREVVKITGIHRPYPKTKVSVNTPQLQRIRIGFHLAESGGELHIVLDIPSAKIHVVKTLADGAKLRIYLEG